MWVALCKPEWVQPPDKVFVGGYGAVVEAAKKWWADRCGFEYVVNDPNPWRDELGEPFGEVSLDDAGRIALITDPYGETVTIFLREAELCEPLKCPEGRLVCGICGTREGEGQSAITYQENLGMPVCTLCFEDYQQIGKGLGLL